MSDKNTISRLYSKGVKLNSALNQSKAENRNKQALIKKQQEQIELLRGALAVMTASYVSESNFVDDDRGLSRSADNERRVVDARKLLAATESDEEEV